jgi:hypothetical protein
MSCSYVFGVLVGGNGRAEDKLEHKRANADELAGRREVGCVLYRLLKLRHEKTVDIRHAVVAAWLPTSRSRSPCAMLPPIPEATKGPDDGCLGNAPDALRELGSFIAGPYVDCAMRSTPPLSARLLRAPTHRSGRPTGKCAGV